MDVNLVEINKHLSQIKDLASEQSRTIENITAKQNELLAKPKSKIPNKITNRVSFKEIIFAWEGILKSGLPDNEKVNKFNYFMNEKGLKSEEMV